MKIFTREIQEAIEFATEIHEVKQRQKRKGDKEIPYISHLFIVALIVSMVTDKNEVIIAAVLHDIAEDSKPPHIVSIKDLEEKFGARVAELVDSVTEKDKTLPWAQRKEIALGKIKTMDHDMMLLKSADTLHNLSTLLSEIKIHGMKVFEVFNAPQEKILAKYKKIIAELKRYWSENPLLTDIEETYTELVEYIKSTAVNQSNN